jgi:hypothetical protein
VRHKRTSKRRWKKRAALRRPIPKWAIVEHNLERWYGFEPLDYSNADVYVAFPPKIDRTPQRWWKVPLT